MCAELLDAPLPVDGAEDSDLAKQHPDIVARMSDQLTKLIDQGATHGGLSQENDTLVKFDTTQQQRWAPRR